MDSYQPWPPPPPPRPRRRWWTTFGIALAVVLAILGLLVVGFFVVAFVSLSNYGSNK
jgi:cytochrome b561